MDTDLAEENETEPNDGFPWPDDDLGDFLRKAHNITLWMLTEPGLRPWYDHLHWVDYATRLIVQSDMEEHPPLRFPRIMLMRARSAFLGACRLVLGGQLAESYLVARGVLEPALFAYLVHITPSLESVWQDRHVSKDTKKECRKRFSASPAFDAIRTVDPQLADDLSYLYEDLIDYGGHPNERSVTPYMKETKYIESIEGEWATQVTHGTLVMASNDPKDIHRPIRRVIQTGVGVLRVYSLIYPHYYGEKLTAGLAEAIQVLWREEIHPVAP